MRCHPPERNLNIPALGVVYELCVSWCADFGFRGSAGIQPAPGGKAGVVRLPVAPLSCACVCRVCAVCAVCAR